MMTIIMIIIIIINYIKIKSLTMILILTHPHPGSMKFIMCSSSPRKPTPELQLVPLIRQYK